MISVAPQSSFFPWPSLQSVWAISKSGQTLLSIFLPFQNSQVCLLKSCNPNNNSSWNSFYLVLGEHYSILLFSLLYFIPYAHFPILPFHFLPAPPIIFPPLISVHSDTKISSLSLLNEKVSFSFLKVNLSLLLNTRLHLLQKFNLLPFICNSYLSRAPFSQPFWLLFIFPKHILLQVS